MSPQATESGNACGIGSLSKLNSYDPVYLRTGLSIRLMRTLLELSVLDVVWLLDGPVGSGTPAFAWLIESCAQSIFRFTIMKLPVHVVNASRPDA